MQLPDPLSINQARGFLDFKTDTELATFLGVTLRVLTYHRKTCGGILPTPYRAMVEAHLLKKQIAAQESQGAGV